MPGPSHINFSLNTCQNITHIWPILHTSKQNDAPYVDKFKVQKNGSNFVCEKVLFADLATFLGIHGTMLQISHNSVLKFVGIRNCLQTYVEPHPLTDHYKIYLFSYVSYSYPFTTYCGFLYGTAVKKNTFFYYLYGNHPS